MDNNADFDKIYVLIQLHEPIKILKRAPLMEIQDWAKYYSGPHGWMDPNPFCKRLDRLSGDPLILVYTAIMGKVPLNFIDEELQKELEEFAAQQVPVDETSLEELRQMRLSRTGGIDKPTTKKPEGENATMITDNGTQAAAKKEAKPKVKGTKQLVRELFSANGAAYSIEELAQKTGKAASAITTALSDLKSPKYCKPGEPLKLYRHSDGKYRTTEEVKAPAAAEAPAGAPPADVLPQV